MIGNPPPSPVPAENVYDELIGNASKLYGIPSEIIKAVVKVESAFRPYAYREEPRLHGASRGLMQTLLSTARGEGFKGDPEELFDPWTSIRIGTSYLARLGRIFGYDWPKVITAYNTGPGNVDSQTGARYLTSVRGAAASMGFTLPLPAAPAPPALELLALPVVLYLILRRE